MGWPIDNQPLSSRGLAFMNRHKIALQRLTLLFSGVLDLLLHFSRGSFIRRL